MRIVDKMFVTFPPNIEIRQSEKYKVPSVLSDDGILASDHRPIFSTIKW